MKLSEWLKDGEGRRSTQAAFAEKVGLSQGRISQIARNGTNDLKTARKIEKATDGQVTVAELEPKEGAAEASPSVGAAQ